MITSIKKSNDSETQRKVLLAALTEAGPLGIATIQAREELDIMAPAPRVYELRHNYGCNIQLIEGSDINAQRNKHRCARYVLLAGNWQGRVAV